MRESGRVELHLGGISKGHGQHHRSMSHPQQSPDQPHQLGAGTTGSLTTRTARPPLVLHRPPVFFQQSQKTQISPAS